MVKLQAYTYEQFYEITVGLLTSDQYNVDEAVVKATTDEVWKTSRNIRDAIKTAKMAKSIEEASWLVTTFLERSATLSHGERDFYNNPLGPG